MRKRIVAGLGNQLWNDEQENDDNEARLLLTTTRTTVGSTWVTTIKIVSVAVAALLCILFLDIGWTGRNPNKNKSRTPPIRPEQPKRFEASSPTSSSPQPPAAQENQSTVKVDNACQSYNTTYFLELLESIRAMPPNASVSNSDNASNGSPLCVPDVVPLKSCRCLNPFVPVPQSPDRVRTWHELSKMNRDLIENNYTSRHRQPDLVLYGDSISERLLGRFFGKYGPKMRDYAHVTNQLMTADGGAPISGLPLGISSDEISHLLYRLQNGVLPPTLQPNVWWILIGTNDLKAGCSVEAIVAGNIRVSEELRRHAATNILPPVVINSILPRGRQPLVLPGNAMWRMITDVNQRLACYASLNPNILFANVTELFVQLRSSDGKAVVHPGMFIKDKLHPSVNGSRVWEEYIVDRVLSLVT